MTNSTLQSGAGQLQESAETLRAKWQDVREVWSDANAARFESEELEPLAGALQLAFPAIAQMSTAMQAMQRELSDQRRQTGDFL
jgi:hypothetical protein